jgi:hypothetical protein
LESYFTKVSIYDFPSENVWSLDTKYCFEHYDRVMVVLNIMNGDQDRVKILCPLIQKIVLNIMIGDEDRVMVVLNIMNRDQDRVKILCMCSIMGMKTG